MNVKIFEKEESLLNLKLCFDFLYIACLKNFLF
jgi:hypothetical protein